MKNKIKSKIRGKDIGEGIVSLIIKTGAKTIPELYAGLEREENNLLEKPVYILKWNCYINA